MEVECYGLSLVSFKLRPKFCLAPPVGSLCEWLLVCLIGGLGCVAGVSLLLLQRCFWLQRCIAASAADEG